MQRSSSEQTPGRGVAGKEARAGFLSEVVIIALVTALQMTAVADVKPVRVVGAAARVMAVRLVVVLPAAFASLGPRNRPKKWRRSAK